MRGEWKRRAATGCRRARRWALCGLLAAVAACSGPRPLLVLSGPEDVTSLEVRDARAVLWKIGSDRPIELSSVSYGIVPAGFRQSVPANGAPPRPFVLGETITTETLTQRRGFLHFGFADGPSSFEISDSEMRLLEPLDPATAAAVRRRHRERLESLGKRLPPQNG